MLLQVLGFAVLLALGGAYDARADAVTIVDTTATGAISDGAIGGAEYVGSGSGVNSGFGDVWGQGSRLYVDSDSEGNIYLGLMRGPTTGSASEFGVIYIDSVAGGITNTSQIADSGDDVRASVSGNAIGETYFNDLAFAPGFEADYAIAWPNFAAGSQAFLFRLNAGAPHTLVATLDLAGAVTGGETHFGATQIGIDSGDSFLYVATYISAPNAYRSDEFHGANFPSGNPGNNVFGPSGTSTLGSGDFNTFTTVAAPSVPAVGLIAKLLLAATLVGTVVARVLAARS